MTPAGLSRVVDLREGEARPAVATGAVLALVVGAHTILETARDALFLARLPPERLPLVYVALAVLSLFAASLSGAFARRFGRRPALVVSLLGSAWLTAVVWLRPATPSLVFVFYILTGVMGTVLTLQFWMFAAELFTVSQGKRLFGPIAAGGVVGATAGAALAAALLGAFPVGVLLVAGAALFVVAAGVLATMQDEDPRGAASAGGATAGPLAWMKDVGVVARDPYVARLAIVTGLGTAAVLVVDYLFKSVAAAEIPDAELGSFFARYYAAQNAVSLLVQLFVAGAIVRRFGVANAVLGLPSLLVASGAAVVLAGGSLPVAIAGKAADGALRHSLHRVSSELLFLPLPGETRDRAKPVIDTVFGRGVQAVTAAAILALAASGWATPRVLGGVVIVLALGWGFGALLLRKPYVDLFRKALSLGEIEPSGRGELDLPSVEALMESLSSRDEDRVLAALDVLDDSGRTRLVPGLILYHESPRVLERALAVVPAPGRKDWVPLAERLLDHEAADVRAAAVRALAAAGVHEAVEKGLGDPNEVVRAYAAFFLANRRTEDDPLGDRRIVRLLDAPGDDGVRARGALLGVIGAHGDARWTGVVEDALARDRRRVLDAGLLAAAARRVADPRFIPHLVARLGSRVGRSEVREALVALGQPAFDAVAAALDDPRTDARVRLHLPRTLSRFRTQQAVDVLTARLGVEESGAVRYKILRGLGRLATHARGDARPLRFDRAAFEVEAARNLVEHLRLTGLRVALDREDAGGALASTSAGSVLAGLLDDKIRQSLERAFRCLQIAHRHEDIHGVYAALRSGDRRARANALEFLDALSLSAASLRDLLRVVVDDLPAADRVRRAAALLPAAPPRAAAEAIRRLLGERDVLLAALSGFHALDLGHLALRDDVERAFLERPELRQLGGRRSWDPSPGLAALA